MNWTILNPVEKYGKMAVKDKLQIYGSHQLKYSLC